MQFLPAHEEGEKKRGRLMPPRRVERQGKNSI
jgi:hypothetical protein